MNIETVIQPDFLNQYLGEESSTFLLIVLIFLECENKMVKVTVDIRKLELSGFQTCVQSQTKNLAFRHQPRLKMI